MSAFVRSHSRDIEPSPASLEALCDVTKRACDALTPMIVAFYNSIKQESETSSTGVKQKKDDSAFTIADGAVQHLLVEHLFKSGKLFRDIVGEEDCPVNLDSVPFTVDDLVIPDKFISLVEKVRTEIESLSREIVECELYKDLTIFIDPIDGTKEFSSGKGEQCSICVGFANGEGLPVAGVVYRPITETPTWAAGAKCEEYSDCQLDVSCSNLQEDFLLTSNGSISPFLEELMSELKYGQQRSGGAGNKMLMLLEGKGSAYIQDRGVSRWDTCAAQACMEAHGGLLIKLTSFMEAKEESYTYLKSHTNLDFQKGVSNLTLYNCRESLGIKKGDPVKSAMTATQLKPYANVCGLFALGRDLNTEEHKRTISEAVHAVTKHSKPSFD